MTLLVIVLGILISLWVRDAVALFTAGRPAPWTLVVNLLIILLVLVLYFAPLDRLSLR